ncbi:MAG: hypothetical protein Q9195_009059 [Heterodermia aff. obscurata]
MAVNGQQPLSPYASSASDGGNSIVQQGFKVTTRKLPILKAEPIDEMTKQLGITPPEMIFGDNRVSVEHINSGWKIQFSAFEALDKVDKTSQSMLQVAHSKEWQSTREKKHEGITEVVKPFDWSYSTDYKGTVRKSTPPFQPSEKPIPLELLKQPDPIIFFDEVMLYEDEMADNGITLLSCKVRVMPARLLLLCRFFMRLDNVLVRIRDTRVYVEFATREVIREYVSKEEKYEVIRQFRETRTYGIEYTLQELLAIIATAQSTGPASAYSVKLYVAHQPFSNSSSPYAQNSPSHPQTQIKATAQSSEPKPYQAKNGDVPSATMIQKVAAETQRLLPSVTETYVAYGVTEKLVKECSSQADYSIPQRNEKDGILPQTKDGEDLGVGSGWWYETLGLTPTFNTWAQVTFLHMYLLTVRLRCFPAEHAPTWHQHLLNHFFYIAEERMVIVHNIQSRTVRNKYLKDLFVQWRGLLAGYDEGLIRGDAVLATAIWRNVFKADNDLDFRGLGEVVSYTRGVLKGLDGMKDDAIASGEVAFGDPGSERAGVLMRSRMMASVDRPPPGKNASISAQAGR